MPPIRCVAPLLVLLLITASASTAIALQGEFPSKVVPGERGERITDPATQARLNAGPAWQEFLGSAGPSWRAQWDQATKTPTRFWGAGIAAPPALTQIDSDLWAWSERFLQDQGGLLGDGVQLDDLRRQTIDRRAGITTVSFVQDHRGLPVRGGRVSLRFKAGRFVVGQIETIPGIRVETSPQVSPAAAQRTALDALDWTEASSRFERAPELLIFPILSEAQVRHHLAWEVRLTSNVFPADRSVFIDATGGEFLGWHEHNRFISGVVLAEIDDRYPSAGRTHLPMVHVELDSPENSASADDLGEFMVAQEGPVDLSWGVGSEHWRIVSQDNNGPASFEGLLENEGDSLVAAPDDDLGNQDTRRVLAQLDIHSSAHVVRARALAINPEFEWALQQATANVNVPLSDEMPGCNAWFNEQSSQVNFLRQGAGCNNTARIADVMYHEYGHGFHGWSIISGAGDFDYALSEGLSDYLCVTITGDPGMAPNFVRESAQPLRNVEPNLVWPQDIHEDTHQTGLIIAGALWDLRSALIEDHGEQEGVALADHIFWQVASRASSIDTTYIEALLADDDNGNIEDGTPNQCAIDEAFNLHGLGPGSAGDTLAYFYLDHPGGTEQVGAWDNIVLEFDAGLGNPDCADGNLSHVVLHYSGDSASALDDWSSEILTSTGAGAFEATLPGGAGGYALRYRAEAIDEHGDVVAVLPVGSRSDPYFTTWIGPRDILWESDFEADDGGFTHSLLSGPDNEGADDWAWGSPGGLSGDPEMASSGDRIWGNDISPDENWNGAYQPGVHNVLRSETLDVGSTRSVHLQFRRWLTVEDGYFDTAWISVNGSTIWSQYSSTEQEGADKHHEDFRWTFRSYDIGDLVGEDGLVDIEWHLESDNGLQFGGWNIDDVALITPGDSGDGPPVSGDATGLSASGQGCACSAGAGASTRAHATVFLLFLGGLGLLRAPRGRRAR